MLISEVIHQLQIILAQNGDMPLLQDGGEGFRWEVDAIQFEPAAVADGVVRIPNYAFARGSRRYMADGGLVDDIPF